MVVHCKRESLVLVDGYNLYHSLRAIEKDTGSKVRWMDVRKLSELLINRLFPPSVPFPHILFFTAYSEHNGEEHVARQKAYHQCLKRLGIEIVCDGSWAQKEVPIAHHYDSLWQPFRWFLKKKYGMFSTPVEKGTDISIAAHLMHLGPQAKWVCLISGDSDLVPAVNLFAATHPTVKFGVARPYKRENRKLNPPHCTNISVEDCKNCLLPNPASTKKREVKKPEHW
jgi:hypothetical protein